MDQRKQQQDGGRAPSAGKMGRGGGGGGKKPIKVVYISNPMRVRTSAAGFRALVQELTGLHADPSKYGFDDDGCRWAQELSPEGSAAASTPDPGPGNVARAAGNQLQVAAAAFAGGDKEDEDIFTAQLLDNDYSVFSPPTLLYDYPPDSCNKV